MLDQSLKAVAEELYKLFAPDNFSTSKPAANVKRVKENKFPYEDVHQKEIFGLGKILATALYLNDISVKQTNFWVSKPDNGAKQLIKMGAEECFARLQANESYTNATNIVTEKDIAALPFVDNYLPMDWLDNVTNGERNDQVEKKIADDVSVVKVKNSFRREVNSAFMKMLILPDDMLKQIIEVRVTDPNEQKIIFDELRYRKDMLCHACCENEQFKDYIKTGKARDEMKQFVQQIDDTAMARELIENFNKLKAGDTSFIYKAYVKPEEPKNAANPKLSSPKSYENFKVRGQLAEAEASGNFSHEVEKATKKPSLTEKDPMREKFQSLWYVKQETNAQREALAGELSRLLWVANPKTRYGVDASGVSYVMSKGIQNAESLENIELADKTDKLIASHLDNGKYIGMGNHMINALFLNDIDFKSGNMLVGKEENGKQILYRIDSGQCFGKTLLLGHPDRSFYSHDITAEDINSLPAVKDYIPHHWCDRVEKGKLNNNYTNFSKNLHENAHFRHEVNQQMMKVLLLSDELLKKFITHYIKDPKEANALLAELQDRKEQLKIAALQNKSFLKYMASQTAQDDLNKFIKEAEAFTLTKKTPLLDDTLKNKMQDDFGKLKDTAAAEYKELQARMAIQLEQKRIEAQRAKQLEQERKQAHEKTLQDLKRKPTTAMLLGTLRLERPQPPKEHPAASPAKESKEQASSVVIHERRAPKQPEVPKPEVNAEEAPRTGPRRR